MSSRKQQSPKNLFNDLLSTAQVNKGFRNGTTGGFTLITHQEEPLQLSDMSDPEYDGKWPTPYMIETYRFTARRLPRIHGRTTRKIIDLTCSYELTLNNAMLPVHIAEDAYGLKGIEAVENGGPSTMEQIIDINIDNEDYELGVHEKVTYTDEEDDEISSTCTCKPRQIEDDSSSTIVFKRDIWSPNDDSEEERSEIQDRPLVIAADTQFSSSAARKLETIDSFTEAEMYAMMDYRDDMEADKVLADLATAYNVVRSMKRSFQRQLGMQFHP